MQDRHSNRQRYFDEQTITTQKYVLPFIADVKAIKKGYSLLEIGCGEGGNLVPFLEAGCERVVGIDLSQGKIENANKFFSTIENGHRATFIDDDIYNMSADKLGQFDIIITRDVLEHIHGQEKFLQHVRSLLKPDGKFFLAFPPWYNPFGGHQQMCKSKVLSKLPYFHIFPRSVYKLIMKIFGENKRTISGLLEIKETGITIERFEKLAKKTNYSIDKRTLYFINPNYEIKFGLKPRVSWKIISSIPYFRDFLITTSYYVISKR